MKIKFKKKIISLLVRERKTLVVHYFPCHENVADNKNNNKQCMETEANKT